MAEQQLSARPRARSVVSRSAGGVTQISDYQPRRYTIIGDHLTQHRDLSLTAIGLGAHIQSLPDGAAVDIRTLSGKFAEGRERIAAALRELEDHGYIKRIRERTPEGRIVTRTLSYNVPRTADDGHAAEPAPEPAAEEPTPPKRERAARPPATTPPPPPPTSGTTPTPPPARPHRPTPPPLPEPTAPAPERHRTAAALLAHRLTALLPPPLPAAEPRSRPVPLQNCDGCDRAFRAPRPGLCRDCREAERYPARGAA
ncbi:helix-turn-helix domain-containing protein [Streptomyces sparsogenes]|uniref:helix-turn-helix domain-containing protein n=1 Tax=Streptomyces sparsogenes TaxID=67365 RepID=UPI00384A4667